MAHKIDGLIKIKTQRKSKYCIVLHFISAELAIMFLADIKAHPNPIRNSLYFYCRFCDNLNVREHFKSNAVYFGDQLTTT